MAFESVDALQRILADTVFKYAADRKKAAGRALGTLVEIITFYALHSRLICGNSPQKIGRTTRLDCRTQQCRSAKPTLVYSTKVRQRATRVFRRIRRAGSMLQSTLYREGNCRIRAA